MRGNDMKTEKKQPLDKDVQAAINKLASDEWFAG